MKPKEFTQKYYPFAKESENKTGISALAIMAQCALETGWAKSIYGNMMFGIKAKLNTPKDKKQLLQTTEILNTPDAEFPEIISITELPNGKYKYVVKDWFIKYDTPEESFTDHGNFFYENPRYIEALLVKDNPEKFIDEISKAGYATDPEYAKKLKNIVKRIKKIIENEEIEIPNLEDSDILSSENPVKKKCGFSRFKFFGFFKK